MSVDLDRGCAIVVGGTGMLRGTTLDLARDGWQVDVLARGRRGLRRVESEAASLSGTVRGVPHDYRRPGTLAACVRERVRERGRGYGLAIAWIHGSAPHGPLELARAVGETRASGSGEWLYVHVLGSAAADPSAPDAGRRAAFEALPGLVYREVILGYVLEGARSRWLQQTEIAAGVSRGVSSREPRTVVGVVEPWSRRP